MHEMSLALELAAIAEQTARDAGATKVHKVTIKVGLLSGVAAEALLFAYDIAVEGTLLVGSNLETRSVPVRVYCSGCERESELENLQLFCCPACGKPTDDIRTGRELELESIEVD